MPVLFNDPFEALSQFQRALDQLRSSDWLEDGPSGSGSYPPVNIFRKGHDIIVLAEVPGVQRQDLQLEVKGNTIRIDQASVHRRERRGGAFDRVVTLPIQIDTDNIKAECRDGLLALYLPRAEHDKPRTIAIS
jgi:HSP20 family protein